MSSAWGSSWGTSWSAAWGREDGVVVVPFIVNQSTIYAPAVKLETQLVFAPRVENVNQFFPVTLDVGGIQLSPALLVNENVFFAADVSRLLAEQKVARGALHRLTGAGGHVTPEPVVAGALSRIPGSGGVVVAEPIQAGTLERLH